MNLSVPSLVSLQLSDAHKLQRSQSFETSHCQCNYSQGEDLSTDQIPLFQVHYQAKVELGSNQIKVQLVDPARQNEKGYKLSIATVMEAIKSKSS